jgi:hypothetical protein
VRLERLRESEECREILRPLDSRGLLDAEADTSLTTEEDSIDEALLASLGIDVDSENDVIQLTHVRSRQEIKAAEEVNPLHLLAERLRQRRGARRAGWVSQSHHD